MYSAATRRLLFPFICCSWLSAWLFAPFLAIAVPAVLPPPLPFKVFVATAGTLEYPRWKFLLTVMVARSLRYYVEGVLAVFYGRRVLIFFKDNGVVIISIVATLLLIGFLIYMFINRRKNLSQLPESTDSDSSNGKDS